MSEAKSLTEYVPEMVLELERLQGVEAEAVAETRRIDLARHMAEVAHHARMEETRKPDRSRVLAEAMLRGEEPPPAPVDPPGAPVEELAATVKGLEALRDEAEKRANEARSALRTTGINLFRTAAQRAAEDYVSQARALEASHAAILCAQMALDAAGAGSGGDILVGPNWTEFKVPGSDQLLALKGAQATAFGWPVLAGGDRETCHKKAGAALEKLRADLAARLGRFPLDRVRF